MLIIVAIGDGENDDDVGAKQGFPSPFTTSVCEVQDEEAKEAGHDGKLTMITKGCDQDHTEAVERNIRWPHPSIRLN